MNAKPPLGRSPFELVLLRLPPGRGILNAEVPRAVYSYVLDLELALERAREKVARQTELRVEAQARAGRLARDSRR